MQRCSTTGLVRQEPSQRWGSLFPLNAWESAFPAACRPPQTGPPITTGQLLPLLIKHPSSPEQIQDLQIASSAQTMAKIGGAPGDS